MKFYILFLLIITLALTGCRSKIKDGDEIFAKIASHLEEGDLESVISLTDSVKKAAGSERLFLKADSLSEIAHRISLEFTLSSHETDSILSSRNISYTAEERQKWEEKGWLESRMINGERRYFSGAVSNLNMVKSFHLDRSTRDSIQAGDPRIVFRKNHAAAVIRSSETSGIPTLPVNIEIIYTITVKPDAVPPGETVRCWMPFPKEGNERQSEVYLTGISNEENFLLAPDTVTHRTLYMEEKARKGEPVIFKISFSYISSGTFFNPDQLKIQPYNKNSALYKRYTVEEPRLITFSDKVRNLADSLAGSETDPYKILRRFYYWFNENIPWSAALEYSIIPDIPEYALSYMRGDCGIQTSLLLSMLRYKGIPARWQSGWMVPPGAENLHDWCEVYFEGIGWVPVDISFGLQFSQDRLLREFYITGIDSYRLIINDGTSGDLYPPKKYLRSEPFDFQRGEVEWQGGNLYFDKWDYDIRISYN